MPSIPSISTSAASSHTPRSATPLDHSYISSGKVIARVDESHVDRFAFEADQWATHAGPTTSYGGTVAKRVPTFSGSEEGNQDLESFRVKTRGRQISLFGTAPTNDNYTGRRIKVSIGGMEPTEISMSPQSSTSASDSTASASSSSSRSPYVYRNWYTSGELPPIDVKFADFTELIFYNVPLDTTVDFADEWLVQFNDWDGSRPVADSADPGIEWSGNWEEVHSPTAGQAGWSLGSQILSASPESMPFIAEPYGGSVHAARSVGDSMMLYFFGESISVWGMAPASAGEILGATFSIDGKQPVKLKFGVPSATSGPMDDATATKQWEQHFNLYSAQGLEPSGHSLFINITEVGTSASAHTSPSTSPGPALCIDYFTLANSPVVGISQFHERSSQPFGFHHDKPKRSVGLTMVLPVVLCTLAVLTILWCFRRTLVLLLLRWRSKKGTSSHHFATGTKRARGIEALQKIRLDLELSILGAKNFVKSTILDIKPMPAYPDPAHLPESKPPVYSFYPQSPSLISTIHVESAPRRGSESSTARGLVGYLSRVRDKIQALTGMERSSWASTWTGMATWTRMGMGSRQISPIETVPPPYQAVGSGH